MSKEKIIYQGQVCDLFDSVIQQEIFKKAYELTGMNFDIQINSLKGKFSYLKIEAGPDQKEKNTLFRTEVFNSMNEPRKSAIAIYHSNLFGVRFSNQKNKPKSIG